MKKIFLSALCLISLLIFNAYAQFEEIEKNDEDEAMEVFNEVVQTESQNFAERMLSVYQKMENCEVAKTEYLEVFGFEEEKCHFKYVDYDCRLPKDVVQEYARLGIKSMQDMLGGKFSTSSEETLKMQKILENKDYCSYEMSWTIEDEDGNIISYSD